MADTYVYSGETISGTVLNSGDTEYVYTGGTAVSTTVNTGGSLVVDSGGLADFTTIDGGTALISGGTATNLTISNGGVDGVDVLSGGVLSGSTILYGTNANIEAGGLAVNVTANNAGLVIGNGGSASGSMILLNGHLDVYAGGTAVDTTVVNGGVQNIYTGGTVSGVTLDYGAEYVYGGTASDVTINYDGRETVYDGGSAAFTQINFGGVLAIKGGTITDTTIAIGGAVSIEEFAYTIGMTATISGGMLNLVSGGVTLYSLAVDGDYTGDTFRVSSDDYAGGGAYITVLCFYAGTHIATPDGETVVEDLREGDLVHTAHGPMAVRWVGQSHVHLRFADKRRMLPIRITAGALGGGLPGRDLLLSPDHALFIDGILVQAAALVNGVSIYREHDVPEQFTYYHVELASHELLWAEGVPAESFVDNVERMHFGNWDDRSAPAAPIPEMSYPRAKSQRQLPAALRARLNAPDRLRA
jgi:autotransporter passenger strand-loop-strand repeat protein